MTALPGPLLAGVREALMQEIAGKWQGGAAAYGDSAIADLAAVSIRSLPALLFPFLSAFGVAERPEWLPRHIAIVAVDDPRGVS